MKSGIIFIAGAVLVGGAVGVALPSQQSRRTSLAVAQVHSAKPKPKPQPHLSAEANARLHEIARKAEYKSRPFRDFLLTGSSTATAEWAGANGGRCGIAPYLRYVIVGNSIGTTRYDEPSDDLWMKLGCEETSPRNQQAILAQQAAQNAKIEADAERWVANLQKESEARLRARDAWQECQHQYIMGMPHVPDGVDPDKWYSDGLDAACGTPPP